MKRSEFDYITGSLHGTHASFHISTLNPNEILPIYVGIE